MNDERGIRRFADRFEWAVFVAAGVAFVMLFTLAGADGNSAAEVADSVDASDAADGADLYGRFCSNCHGDNGEGGVGPRLEVLDERYPDDATLLALVANGRGIMPGFVTTLTTDEIAAVVGHLRSRFG